MVLSASHSSHSSRLCLLKMAQYHRLILLTASLTLVILCQLSQNHKLTSAHRLNASPEPLPHYRQFPSWPPSINNNKNNSTKQILIKLALFLDTSLEHHLRDNLSLNETRINRLIVAYVDQIGAIFASLRSGTISKIHIALVETRFETRHSNQFATTNTSMDGDIDKLLSEFCLYQATEREKSKIKWDLGLLLTAKDLYSTEEAQMNSMEVSLSTMGISPVNGIGWPDLSCSIVELGVGYSDQHLMDSSQQRVYPTRGFASAWIAAHEVAHSLGLHHDGSPFNGECNSDQWIMSPTSYVGSMNHLWSICSKVSLDSLNLTKFTIPPNETQLVGEQNKLDIINLTELPGQIFDAQFQCRMYSSLLSQTAMHQDSICNETLKCLGPNNQLVTVGPALEGTRCGIGGGICIQNLCKIVHLD